jgi:hypothetical protein
MFHACTLPAPATLLRWISHTCLYVCVQFMHCPCIALQAMMFAGVDGLITAMHVQ